MLKTFSQRIKGLCITSKSSMWLDVGLIGKLQTGCQSPQSVRENDQEFDTDSKREGQEV